MRYFIFLMVAALVTGCITRQEIRANLWLNNTPLPTSLCEREPVLNDYGFFRRLNNGTLEFISFCNPLARDHVAIRTAEFEKILNELLPKKRTVENK